MLAVLYADDISVLVFTKNLKDLQTKIDSTLHHTCEWFLFNGLTLTFIRRTEYSI